MPSLLPQTIYHDAKKVHVTYYDEVPPIHMHVLFSSNSDDDESFVPSTYRVSYQNLNVYPLHHEMLVHHDPIHLTNHPNHQY
jgi:hypothetical protein